MPLAASILLVENLDQMLKDLDAVCTDWKGDELQNMAKEAEDVLMKLRSVLKRTRLQQVAKLVQEFKWDEAIEMMEQNFPGGSTNIGLLDEVSVLVYVGKDARNLMCIIEWVGQLDVQYQPMAFKTLFQQIKSKGHSDQPEMLLLSLKIDKLSDDEGVLESVRAQLFDLCNILFEKIFEDVRTFDSCYLELDDLHKSSDGELVLRDIVTKVVQNFDVNVLETTLQLIQYSLQMNTLESSWFLIDEILRALEEQNLLDSQQALHVFAHVKYYYGEKFSWDNVSNGIKKMCTDAMTKLEEHKHNFLQHYQKYVEDQDKQIIYDLLTENCYLRSIVCEFVTWYYKQDDLTRVTKIVSAARATKDLAVIGHSLTQLHSEMQKYQQLNTLEAFCLFHELKMDMSMDTYKSLKPEEKLPWDQMKAQAPTCFSHLLWPEEDENQLQLVNKFFGTPLSIQEGKVLCCNSKVGQEQFICSAFVDPETSKTTFSFKSGSTCWKLDNSASTDDTVKAVSLEGTRWNVKAEDKYHVKIFSNEGQFLMAGEPLLGDENKRVVCLKRENNIDLQVWKIELAKRRKNDV